MVNNPKLWILPAHPTLLAVQTYYVLRVLHPVSRQTSTAAFCPPDKTLCEARQQVGMSKMSLATGS